MKFFIKHENVGDWFLILRITDRGRHELTCWTILPLVQPRCWRYTGWSLSLCLPAASIGRSKVVDIFSVHINTGDHSLFLLTRQICNSSVTPIGDACDLMRMTTVINTLSNEVCEAMDRVDSGGIQSQRSPAPVHYSPSVRLLSIPKLQNGACGFNLTRSKWDPYPWASSMCIFLLCVMWLSDCVIAGQWRG